MTDSLSDLCSLTEIIKAVDERFESIINRLEDIQKDLSHVEQKTESVISTCQEIELKLNSVTSSVGKMDEHVDFVNDVYDQVKAPFHQAMNAVTNAISYGSLSSRTPPNTPCKLTDESL